MMNADRDVLKKLILKSLERKDDIAIKEMSDEIKTEKIKMLLQPVICESL